MATEVVEPPGTAAKPTAPTTSPYNFAHTLPVVLEMIARHLSGVDILALCQTCSHPLLVRLLKASVTKFEITSVSPRTWNGLQFSFLKHMTRLEICNIASSTLKIWHAGPALFDKFPSSLLVIKLTIPVQFGQWLRSSMSTPPQLELKPAKRPKKVKHLPPQAAPVFRISEQFPGLQELHITGGIHYTHAPMPYILQRRDEPDRYRQEAEGLAKFAFFSSLPSSVTRVSLPALGTWTWRAYYALPQNINWLSMTCHSLEILPTGFDRLPPRLQSLVIETPFCLFHSTLPLFPDLPPDLEHFQWLASGVTMSAANCFAGFSTHSCLRSVVLDITDVTLTEDLFSFWPQTLESLKITLRSIAGQLFGEALFASLPRKLLSFEVDASNPRLLRTDLFLPTTGCDELPKTLTHLKLGDNVVLDDNDVACLPRNLTSLHLDLHLNTCQDHICNHDCQNRCHERMFANPRLGKLSSMCSDSLPPNLTYLKLSRSNFLDSFYATLPETLKTLEIETAMILTAEVFAMLPTGLTALKILKGPEIHVCAYEQLPRGLLTLHVTSGVTHLREDFWSSLPGSLTRLCLLDNTCFKDRHAVLLPRTLKELRLPKAGDHLTSKCGAGLPPEMTILDVKHIALANPRPSNVELVASFPRHVPVYDLKWVNHRGKPTKLSPVTSSPTKASVH